MCSSPQSLLLSERVVLALESDVLDRSPVFVQSMFQFEIMEGRPAQGARS